MGFPFTIAAEARVPLPPGAGPLSAGVLLARVRRELVERHHAEDVRRVGDAGLEFRRELHMRSPMRSPLALVHAGTVRARIEPAAAVFDYDLRLTLMAVWSMTAGVAVHALIVYNVATIFVAGGRWLAVRAVVVGVAVSAASLAYYYWYWRAGRGFRSILFRACETAVGSRPAARSPASRAEPDDAEPA